MNFAPYQDASPENVRAMSPPLRSPTHSPRPSLQQNNRPSAYGHARSGSALGTSALASPTTDRYASSPSGNNGSSGGYFGNNGRQSSDLERGAGGGGGWISPGGSGGGWGGSSGFGRAAFGGGREEVDLFETRLGIRMDYEACLAYLLLPPAGGVLLLVLEHRSDYVRFHAWQSALLFSFMFVVHIIFSWSTVISWLLFVGDLGAIGYLTMRAYRDAETLDRCEVPFFGHLASSILDDE